MKTKEKKDILSVLEHRLASFSKSQRVIAHYILDNYDKAAFMTASRLGEAVGVSESTVVRFAAELGYRGYPGMKKALQEIVRNRLTAVERIEAAENTVDTQDVLKAVLRADVNNLQATLDEIDQTSFNAAVEQICTANKIYIIGMRTSTTLAKFFWFYLNLLRENVYVIQDTAASEAYEQMLRVQEGDLVIGISFPRYSSRTVKAMKFAYDRGATVIALTDSRSAPIAQNATHPAGKRPHIVGHQVAGFPGGAHGASERIDRGHRPSEPGADLPKFPHAGGDLVCAQCLSEQ